MFECKNHSYRPEKYVTSAKLCAEFFNFYKFSFSRRRELIFSDALLGKTFSTLNCATMNTLPISAAIFSRRKVSAETF
jgi:hypothetical protein